MSEVVLDGNVVWKVGEFAGGVLKAGVAKN